MKKQDFFNAMESNYYKNRSEFTQVEGMISALINTIQDELKTDAMESKVPGMGTFKLVTNKSGELRMDFKPAKGF